MSGALIRTELGICPSAHIALETLTPTLGLTARELPASIVRTAPGELAVEWIELASTSTSAVLLEARLTSGGNGVPRPVTAFGRVRFCALAPEDLK